MTSHRLEMLPPASTTTAATTSASASTRNNRTTVTLTNMPKLSRLSGNLTVERCCFLFIHVVFYAIILTIVYVRLEQFTDKQEKLLYAFRANDNLTLHRELHRRLLDYNHSHVETAHDCSHPLPPHPKRNRTTRCLQLRVGSEIIDNIFCPNDERSHWLSIQNHESNALDFNRTWSEYRRGFGDIRNRTEFWIGNENLHWLSTTYSCRLKIELTDWYNETRTATYELFRVASQQDGYRLQISDYHGDMESANKFDSFSRWHHNARFSTVDHFATSANCPQQHGGGGWWYHSGADCAHVQLNGRLATHSDGLVPFNTGILWIGWKPDRHYSFQRVNMAIQPKAKPTRLLRRT